MYRQKIALSLLLWCVTVFATLAQAKLTISGYLKDAKNGETLIGATVLVKETGNGVASNEYGFYSITLPAGNYTLIYSFIGYQPQTKTVTLNQNTKLDIEFSAEETALQEVVVTEQKAEDNVLSNEMSVNKVDISTIRKMPALLGEVDVIRSIQLLPGVTSVGEGATGFNVRGGNVDQNLVLLDEAPIFNSSHLFGFFSVFNPDAVKDIKLVKGGIPSQYGGRLSSLLDVRLKEGNAKRFSGQGGIGVIFSRLTLEAPIVKDKGSILIAARRSYIDVLAKPFLASNLQNSAFYFYDLTAKANYTLSSKDKIFLSGYFGRDKFGAGFQFNWGNATTSLRWNHVYGNRLFSNVTLFYSNYDYLLGTDGTNAQGDGFKWTSNIINYSVKPEFTYFLNPKNTITFGGQATLYTFKPGTGEVTVDRTTRIVGLDDKNGLEAAIYVGNEQKINNKLSLQYGLRYSYFRYMGDGLAYTFGDTTAGIRKPFVSSKNYGSWET
ncbi:MAG: TonB-dependent receptor, partial [Thermoflexibacteraceae bacterium]